MSESLPVLRDFRIHSDGVGVIDRAADPPAEFEPDTFAARLYEMLGPLARVDSQVGWSLLILCNAVGTMFQLLEDLSRDTPEGPGWSLLLDLERCPDWALPWLAQFIGVRLLPDSTPDEQRARIASTDGFNRGTRQSLIGAARATLTPPGAVLFRERDHDPADTPDYAYYLTVITYDSQTPNPAATLNALLAQKPAGIVLTYRVSPGQDYQSVHDRYADYAALKAGYPDYAAVRDDEPFE